MKKDVSSSRASLVVFLLGLEILAFLQLSQNQATVTLISEAYATPQAGTAAVSGTCSDTPITGFSPNVDNTITFAAVSQSSAPTCTATMVLSNAINGDTAPSLGCSITDVPGYVILSSRMPTIKIGGLVCNTEDRAQLEVHGDGSDNLKMDVAISTVGSTVWDNSKKVDAATSSSKIMLFGTNGQVGSSAIIDGQDNDGLTNGEVAFGGTVASEGGSRLYTKTDFTNYVPDPAVDRETLTFSITSQ